MSNKIKGMQATIVAAIRDEFAPRLAALEERLDAATKRIGSAKLSATLLRDEFALKFSELNACIGTEDDSINDLEARAAPSLSSLAARVSVLEPRPAVVLGPGPSLPPETSQDGEGRPNGNPPSVPPPANHPLVRPWVDTAASSPTVRFGQDGLSPKDRAPTAWANSPSGQAAAAQAPASSQPRPLDTPPIPASTPP